MNQYLRVFAVALVIGAVSALPLTITQVTTAGSQDFKVVLHLTLQDNSDFFLNDDVSCGLFPVGAAQPPATSGGVTSGSWHNTDGPIASTDLTLSAVTPGSYKVWCTHDRTPDATTWSNLDPVTALPAFTVDTPTFPAVNTVDITIKRSPEANWEAGSMIACRISETTLGVITPDALAADGTAKTADASGATSQKVTFTTVVANKQYYYQCTAYLSTTYAAVQSGTFTTAPANPAITVTNGAGKVTVVVKRSDFPNQELEVSAVVCEVQVGTTTARTQAELLTAGATSATARGYAQLDNTAGVATSISKQFDFTGLNGGPGKVYCAFEGPLSDASANAAIDITPVQINIDAMTTAPSKIVVRITREDNANFDYAQPSVSCLAASTDVSATITTPAALYAESITPAPEGYRAEATLGSNLNTFDLEITGLGAFTFDVYCAFAEASGSSLATATDIVVAQNVAVTGTTGTNGRLTVNVKAAYTSTFVDGEDSVACMAVPLVDSTFPADLSALWSTPTAYDRTGNYLVVVDGLLGTANGDVVFDGLIEGDYNVYCGFEVATNSEVVKYEGATVAKADAPTVTAAPLSTAKTEKLEITYVVAAAYGRRRCIVSKDVIADADFWTTVAAAGSVMIAEGPVTATSDTVEVTTNSGAWKVKCAWQNSAPAAVTADIPCPAGEGVSSGACAECSAGTYSLYPAANTYGDCASCSPGKTTAAAGADDVASCVCAKGYQVDAASCQECTAGTYGDELALAECKSCPALKTSAAGSDDASDCVCQDGYEDDGAGSCTICDAGKFSTNGDPCQVCPGDTMSSAGAAMCVCPAGHVRQEDDTCTPCALNEKLVDNACVACDANTFSPAASEICCPLGQGVEGANTCVGCAENTYSAGGVCAACATGKFSQAGATSSAECCVAHSAFSGDACICDNNFEDNEGVCDACEQGKYSTGGAACEACPADQYLDGMTCMNCPEETYTPSGAYAEKQCCTGNATFVEADDACVCKPGYETVNDLCIQCSVGKWSVNGTACVACAANQYLDNGVCTDCATGKHSQAGSYMAGHCCVEHADYVAAADACVCAAGYEMKNGVCAACEAGKYRKTADTNTVCAACPTNTFSPVAGRSTDCVACPGGLYSGAAFSLSTTTCHCNATGSWVALTSVQTNSTCKLDVKVPSGSARVVPAVTMLIALLLALIGAAAF